MNNENGNPIISVAFQVIPKVSGSLNAYDIVDKAIKIVQDSGVKFEVGPMETTMEGQQDELFNIVKQAQDECIKNGALEVMTFVKIHYRPSGVTISEKVSKYR
ncbi:thiamine-binding protein [Fluviispira vulneris]|uniref:thiamine-binding protein n=1 Tax=Fluviispira vulneris TaxID=2763012 RepID=UPI00164795E6